MMIKLNDTKIESWISLIRTQQFLLEQVENDLKQAGLPPLPWYDVLLELKRAPNGRLRLNEIGARILLEKSNLTRLVDRLENEMLLVRATCDSDRRGAYAVITTKGRALQKRMWPVYATAIENHFASKLTQQEAEILLGLLNKLDTSNPDTSPSN